MKIERLVVRNFRNLESCELRPCKRLNFLIGKNGQGKTSILESIGYLATLRSFRGAKPPEVVRWDSATAEISAEVVPDAEPTHDQDWRSSLKVVFCLSADRQKASKAAFINGKPFRSSTQYLSQRFGSYRLGFHAVVFNPSDHDLVRGEPAQRRSYLDRLLAANDIEYLRLLQRYQRILEQRNTVLKSPQSTNAREVLEGFTEPLTRFGAEIVRRRLESLQRLQIFGVNTLQQIAPNLPSFCLNYRSNLDEKSLQLSSVTTHEEGLNFAGQGPLPSLEHLEKAFRNQVSNKSMAEWKVGYSLVGPHRDDWGFSLGRVPLKGHGSQGEVRSILLALKLAEIELFQSETGHRPLFLLDDFSSELDKERREFLLRMLCKSDLQVFITTTEEREYEGKRFLISHGALQEI